MKNIYKKIIIKISILMLFVLAFSNYSYANNELSLNNAPRKFFTVDSDKFADVTVTIKDGNGINSVRLYSVDSEWKMQKKLISLVLILAITRCIFIHYHIRIC